MPKATAIVFSPDGAELPAIIGEWLRERELPQLTVRSADELMSIALRGRPRVVVFDARTSAARALEACERLKRDSYTAIVPSLVYAADGERALVEAFDAGGDEVIRAGTPKSEAVPRLDVLLRRSDRDVNVHTSTRLPGTIEIDGEIERRMASDEPFAVCYADLDHFKEYNDRYSYAEGDQVIRILAKILHDVVKGVCGEGGFVGHIGGDDFIFILPAAATGEVCAEIISVFDTLIPFQYSELDRRAEYFFGKDRRGQLHRVPLMTVSIGVVTNERRRFATAAQVSELATEMKSYAKTLVGSVYAVDRRQDSAFLETETSLVLPESVIGGDSR